MTDKKKLKIKIFENNYHSLVLEVSKKISEKKEGVVFLLWGNFAKAKKELIDDSKHFILESAHPSPLAGNRFFDNHHFSKTNEILTGQNKTPIDWQV